VKIHDYEEEKISIQSENTDDEHSNTLMKRELIDGYSINRLLDEINIFSNSMI
jgi:hypothetical protein